MMNTAYTEGLGNRPLTSGVIIEVLGKTGFLVKVYECFQVKGVCHGFWFSFFFRSITDSL